MLISEIVKSKIGTEFIHYYSDSGYYILENETNEKYEDVLVPIEYSLGRTFVETTEKIPEPIEPEEI